MKKVHILLLALSLLWSIPSEGSVPPFNSGSVYTARPSDPGAVYFSPSAYGVGSSSGADITQALQQTINKLKREKNYGIVFIPEGTYRISKTVYIPPAIRLIGYGKKRPVFVLGSSTPGYQVTTNYMFWFTGDLPEDGKTPSDANPGTFYSAISNIDFKIEKGNPSAAAIRAHFAQHCFISHCDFNLEDALCGIYEAGNEIEDLRFFGGQSGIVTGRASPGWPIMMTDCYFTGQSRCAVLTREAGFACVNVHADSVPVVFEFDDRTVDRLFVENSLFENVSDAAIRIAVSGNTFCQLNLRGVECNDVPTLVRNKETGGAVTVEDKAYLVREYTYGLVYDNLGGEPEMKEMIGILPRQYTARSGVARKKEIPLLPSSEKWVSVRDFGAMGDGQTDDSAAFRSAIASGRPVYVPTGKYLVSKTIELSTAGLIGLHPFATQIILAESTPAFSGFGGPVPVILSSYQGPDILNGIGINTGAYNYRAVGVKWIAGARSYLNDVKFIGGHGTMRDPSSGDAPSYRPQQTGPSSPSSPRYDRGKDLAWDNQYWSLWVAKDGGGTFKDIWTASTYSSAGLYIDDTATPGRIFAMSLEHHVRTEAILRNVKGWKMYAVQFEEEGVEGPDCYNMEMSGCEDLTMANVWMYRVIRAKTPKDKGIRLWGGKNLEFLNMHSYTQVLPVIDYPIYEMGKAIPVGAWDFARLSVSGFEKSRVEPISELYEPVRIASGFSFPTGATVDSRGNAFFVENSRRKIYKWDASTRSLGFLADSPWKPFSLGMDTRDNLLVVFRYDPQPGYMVDGKQEEVDVLPDDNPMYSGWGNGGWRARCYSFAQDDVEDIKELRWVRTGTLKTLQRVFVPASRWRGDYEKVVSSMPEYCWVAPDGWSILPDTYDLGRNTSLVWYAPLQDAPVFIVNENNKTTMKYKADASGKLTRPEQYFHMGQYSTVADDRGNLYVADGDIYVLSTYGELHRVIRMPERPLSMTICGKDSDQLLVTTPSSIYMVRIR